MGSEWSVNYLVLNPDRQHCSKTNLELQVLHPSTIRSQLFCHGGPAKIRSYQIHSVIHW